MKRLHKILVVGMMLACALPFQLMAQQKFLTLDDINIRDPFILPVEEEDVYYMYSSSSVKENGKTFGGVVAYKSKDLKNWEYL